MKRVRWISRPRPAPRRRNVLHGLALSALLCAPLGGEIARADATAAKTTYAVIPITHGGGGRAALLELAEQVHRELDRRDLPHLTAADARERIVARHSRDPIAFSELDAEHFLEKAREGDRAATAGEWARAISALRSALDEGERALESVNRHPENAKHFWHACLLLTRVYAQSGDADQALAQARQCRAYSPSMVLAEDDRTFPGFVHRLLREADRQLESEHRTTLLLDSTSGDCTVRANGLLLGPAPAELVSPEHYPYRVQVECVPDKPGRVHALTPPTESTLTVDGLLEAAIRTHERALLLDYAHVGSEREKLMRAHLRALSAEHLLNVEQVLAISRAPDGRITLRRVGHADGNAVILTDPKRELSTALTRVLESAENDEPAAPATALPSGSVGSKTLLPWHKGVGISSIVLGGVALAGAGWSYRAAQRDADALQVTTWGAPDFAEVADAWRGARRIPYYVATPGVLLLSAGSLGLMIGAEDRSLVPWWLAGLAGATGVGLATWGAVDVARGARCSGPQFAWPGCVDDQALRDRGGLLLLASLPALAVLATKLAIGDSPITLTPAVDRQRVTLLARIDH